MTTTWISTRTACSTFLPSPTRPPGKYGPLTVAANGHFEFKNQPGVPAKFWGVNICTQALYMEKDMADHVADRLMRSGYNVVRIHHFDRDLLKKGENSYDIDPDQLDKLEYFVSALEKRGIYINIDLFTLRNFSDAEAASFGWPADRSTGFDRLRWYKASMPISDAAFDSWKKFSTNLLTHRNPYTGMTWAEDPALIGICPLNEDTLVAHVSKIPALAQKYDELFATWSDEAANHALARDNPAAAFNQFILEKEQANDDHMREFLRSIGVQAPITGCNYIDSEAQAFLRNGYDYVDDHDYWDMPHWLGAEWSLPFLTPNKDPVVAAAQMPRDMMPSRILGKPFTVTEYSYVWPTHDRAAGGILMSAYASLQDWDGIYYFAYGGKIPALQTPGRSGILDLAPDPTNLLADRVAALIFRRGDIKPAPHAICFAVDKDVALAGLKGVWHGFPKSYSFLGLLTRIGDSVAKPDAILGSDVASKTGIVAVVADPQAHASGNHIYRADDSLLSEMRQDHLLPAGKDNDFTSETGQIELGSETGLLKVLTDKSECFVLPPHQQVNGNFVHLQNGDSESAVSVVAVDNKPLGESQRILVLHLTDSLNMGMTFKDSSLTQAESWGDLPHMVRHGETDVTFQVSDPDSWRAWAVDASGKHLGEVDLQKVDDGFLLKADTTFKDTSCLAYELAHK